MKKILLTATMLVSLSAFVKAQQRGVGINTTTPAATLDVVANIADTTMPDAVLVPRMTEDQLAAKNAAYGTPQNGALVFVNTVDGATTAKTVNVTATGFYYYDAPNSVWKAFTSGSITPTLPTFRTISSGSTAVILASDVDNCVILNASTISAVTLPTPTAAMAGRTIRIFETSGSASPTITNTEYKSTTSNPIVTNSGISLITDGINWYSDSLQ